MSTLLIGFDFVFFTVGGGGGAVSALLKLKGNGDCVLVSDLRVFWKGVRDLKEKKFEYRVYIFIFIYIYIYI